MANKILNLDLSKNPIMQPIIYGRVGDGYSPTVTVNITDNDEIVDLTDYVIKFEGVTSKDTFVVDPGVTSSAAGLKNGTFSYLFPSRAFSVLGQYKFAYFSVVKGFTRKTTGNFKIIVADIADINKEEAQAVIIEYDQLVEKLNASYTAAVKAYDEESQKKLLALQKQIDQQMEAQDAKIETQSKAIGAVTTQIDAINKSISGFETRMKALENNGAALKTEAQMKKITDDNGNAETIGNDGFNESFLNSIISKNAGLRTYILYVTNSKSTITDAPPENSNFRCMVNMVSELHGNVIGVTDNGNTYIRNIISKTWVGNWVKVVDENKLLDKIYPIGSVYTNVSNTNPGAQLGGTWALIGQGANATYMWKRTA